MPKRTKVIFVPALVCVAGAAQAELQICNDTDVNQSISVGYEGAGGWTSEGWWNIDAGECAAPLDQALTKRYYYLRVERSAGNFQGGGYFFCTSSEAFTIVGDTGCAERGYEREDYIELDIGTGTRSYTYRLEQAQMDLAQGASGREGLTFCNQTDVTQAVTVGYETATGWISRGWWNVDAGECSTPLPDALEKRYYYYRAEVKGGPFEGGGYTFCTTPELFNIDGDSDCEARGYETEDYAEIDVGVGATGYQFDLTSATGGVVEGGSSALSAGLEFCNETEHVQGISIGYQGTEDWTSEGWWNVDPGACVTPISDPLERRYYYYRAEVRGGDFAGGGYGFCTSQDAYTIVGDSDCEGRGYTTEDFTEIDIGADSTGYSVTLTAANSGVVDATNAGSDPTAGLRFCNQTEAEQSVAVGYQADDGWTSSGWWNIAPGDCARPLTVALDKRYYYYRAEVQGGPFDGGQGFTFCTTPEAFTILGDTDCEARGYDTEDFREIDVGVGVTDYTLNLSGGGSVDTASSTTTATGDNASATDTIDATPAGIEVCNESGVSQSLAFGYESADGWVSEGWWVVDMGACATPALDGARHRYLYYRAEADDSRAFEGQQYYFCTTSEAFTIEGDSECAARGYERAEFREVDIGTEGMFTLTLVDPSAVPAISTPSTAPTTTSTTPSTTLGDRLGGEAPVVEAPTEAGETVSEAVPESAPVSAPDSVSEPEAEPETESEPEGAPEPEAPSNPRRTGSRG